MLTRHLLTLMLALGSAAAIAGQVYSWTDASGKRHFSDKPPPGVEATKTGIRTSSPVPSGPAAGGAQQSTGDAPAAPKTWKEKAEAADKRRTEQAEESAKAQKEADQAQRKKDACERATAQLKLLESGARVQRVGDGGEREVLDDAGRAEEIARTRQVMSDACN